MLSKWKANQKHHQPTGNTLKKNRFHCAALQFSKTNQKQGTFQNKYQPHLPLATSNTTLWNEKWNKIKKYYCENKWELSLGFPLPKPFRTISDVCPEIKRIWITFSVNVCAILFRYRKKL